MNSEEFVNKMIVVMSDIEPISKSDYVCAPGREYEAGSCASLAVLEEMARAYNKTASSKDKIRVSDNMGILNPQKYKVYLVYQINKRVGDRCDTQKCWSSQDFVKHMSKATRVELLKYTFRPNSPQGRFDWLSTFDINDSMGQYEKKYPNFKFFGAVPMDFANLNQCDNLNRADYAELHKSGITKIGVIFNLDESTKSGSHWVAMYTDFDKGTILYFDSFGVKPEKRIRALMRNQSRYMTDTKDMAGGSGNKTLKDIRVDYNKVQHQKKNTECGVYSMNFLIRMVRGDNFDELCNTPISDDKINKCRKIYFDRYANKKQ
jgi:hypothetical protein